MTSVNWLHYNFIQEAHRTDSSALGNLSVAQRDHFLNAAKDNLLEFYADLVETEDLVRQFLREVTKRDITLKGEDKGEKYIADYPEDFLKPLKIYAVAGKEGCIETRRLKVRRLSSDKIERALSNSNTRRFWDFEETFGLESDKGFEIYQGDTKIEKAVLDYVRKVKDVQGPDFEDAEQYISAEGEAISTNVNLEISHKGFAHRVVLLGVLLAHRALGNVQDFSTRYQTIVNLERVFN